MSAENRYAAARDMFADAFADFVEAFEAFEQAPGTATLAPWERIVQGVEDLVNSFQAMGIARERVTPRPFGGLIGGIMPQPEPERE